VEGSVSATSASASGHIFPKDAALVAAAARLNAPAKEGGANLMGETRVSDVQPRAQSALASSPIYDLRELRVEQRNGSLVIHGCVSSFYHKQLAQEVVRSVCRDIELINSIRVQ
jgi:hypothetical protein